MSKSWLLIPLLLLYLLSLGGVGMLGPDEPRYAFIGREMALSGDWVTPRLYGEGWFEKPPLVYWMNAGFQKLGFHDEWAARLPVVLASLAFLAFFYTVIREEYSSRVAAASVAILATSAGWLAYSFAALTDLPMAAALGVAMMMALFDTRPKQGYVAGAFLGLAILAKGFVPVVLFAPVWLISRRQRLAQIAGTVLVAAPWYVLCLMRNGPVFWNDFFWKQHVQRFVSPDLQHVQPFWYYLPVLLAGLFPWTPLAALLLRRKLYDDIRIRTLMFWVLFGFVFFSVSKNKLPGYLLPLMPALALILAVALDKAKQAPYWLAACTALLVAFPVVAAVLPEGLRTGITHVQIARSTWMIAGGLAVPILAMAGLVWWLGRGGRMPLAILLAALSVMVAAGALKVRTFPALDELVSVRSFWRNNQDRAAQACIDPRVSRTVVYGLSYYAGRGLPECREDASPEWAISVIRGSLTIAPSSQLW